MDEGPTIKPLTVDGASGAPLERPHANERRANTGLTGANTRLKCTNVRVRPNVLLEVREQHYTSYWG